MYHHSLINELTEILQLLETDMTFFVNFVKMNLRFPSNITEENLIKPLEESYYIPKQMTLQRKKYVNGFIHIKNVFENILFPEGKVQKNESG